MKVRVDLTHHNFSLIVSHWRFPTFGALRHARDLLATQDFIITCYVAEAFGFARGTRDQLLDGEADLLRSLLLHEDSRVRQLTVTAAHALAGQHRALAVELVTSGRFGDSLKVADAVAAAFGGSRPSGFLVWTDLSDSQADQFLEQLRRCPSIDEYSIMVLLAEITRSRPEAVLKLLMDRVEMRETDEHPSPYCTPLPHMWHVPLNFKAHDQYARFLRAVRDWISDESTSSTRISMGTEIFATVAGRFDDQVTVVILESIESGDKKKAAIVGALLCKAPRSLVWDVDFVCRTLNAAARHGDECVRTIGDSLRVAAITGGSEDAPRLPLNDVTGQISKAASIAASLPPGSIEEIFYRSLATWKEAVAQWVNSVAVNPIDARDW